MPEALNALLYAVEPVGMVSNINVLSDKVEDVSSVEALLQAVVKATLPLLAPCNKMHGAQFRPRWAEPDGGCSSPPAE